MVTGRFDSSSLKKNNELRQKCDEQTGGVTDVQACHILGESRMQRIDGEGAVPNKVCVITVSRVPCHPHLLPRINSLPLPWPFSGTLDSKILPKNFLRQMVYTTLGIYSRCHPICIPNLTAWVYGSKPPTWCVIGRLLDGLNLTRAQPNCYEVCTYFEGLKGDLTRFGYLRRDGNRLLVTFSSHVPDARLPDGKLLTLHAVCARVAHLSGAAEAIDEWEQDAEDIRVLAFDGSSARLLDHLIAPFAIVPGVP